MESKSKYNVFIIKILEKIDIRRRKWIFFSSISQCRQIYTFDDIIAPTNHRCTEGVRMNSALRKSRFSMVQMKKKTVFAGRYNSY